MLSVSRGNFGELVREPETYRRAFINVFHELADRAAARFSAGLIKGIEKRRLFGRRKTLDAAAKERIKAQLLDFVGHGYVTGMRMNTVLSEKKRRA